MTSTWTRCLMRTWIVLLLLVFNTTTAQINLQPCQISSRVVSVTENVAVDTQILKISLKPNVIWTLDSKTPSGYFKLRKGNSSYYLVADRVLDAEVLKKNRIDVYLLCKHGNNQIPFKIAVLLTKVNEFSPKFNQSLYNSTVRENARINDFVFLASAYASDKDYGDSMTFDVVPSKSPLDGIASGKFKMDFANGRIVVASSLDYEKQKKYTIGIIVKDSGGLENSATLVIYISDVDDLGPTFLPKPCTTKNPQCMIPVRYNAHIKAADKGKLTILPNAVEAVDDEVNHYNVVYSFTKEGNPTNIEKYFQLDSKNAVITKTDKELPKNMTSSVTLFIKAEEVSSAKHSSIAILIIDILDRNSTVIISTKSSDSISVSKIQGYSSDVFYGVLIPLVIIVAALIIFIIVIVIKSKRTPFRNSVEDLNTKTNKPDASSVVIQTTDSLLSRKSVNGTKRPTVETVENGYAGMTNQAFVPDTLTENGEVVGDNKEEDNDIHPRSLHGDLSEFDSCNLASAGIYTAVEDLSKAGIAAEGEAKDGDIDKGETDESEASEFPYSTLDDLKEDTEETSSNQLPDMPPADYILDEPQSQDMTWVVPATSGQLESEISEVLLTPDFIENVSLRSASLESVATEDSLQIEGLPESTGTTDGNHPDSNSMTEKDKKDDTGEDNRLPVWASEALQPTIHPIISREDFKSHLESLISSPPQLPSSKTLQTPPSPSLTPSPSPRSLESASGGKPPSPPPLPQQPPSSSAEETLPTPIPTAPPLPPPLPPIQMVSTHF